MNRSVPEQKAEVCWIGVGASLPHSAATFCCRFAQYWSPTGVSAQGHSDSKA